MVEHRKKDKTYQAKILCLDIFNHKWKYLWEKKKYKLKYHLPLYRLQKDQPKVKACLFKFLSKFMWFFVRSAHKHYDSLFRHLNDDWCDSSECYQQTKYHKWAIFLNIKPKIFLASKHVIIIYFMEYVLSFLWWVSMCNRHVKRNSLLLFSTSSPPVRTRGEWLGWFE